MTLTRHRCRLLFGIQQDRHLAGIKSTIDPDCIFHFFRRNLFLLGNAFLPVFDIHILIEIGFKYATTCRRIFFRRRLEFVFGWRRRYNYQTMYFSDVWFDPSGHPALNKITLLQVVRDI